MPRDLASDLQRLRERGWLHNWNSWTCNGLLQMIHLADFIKLLADRCYYEVLSPRTTEAVIDLTSFLDEASTALVRILPEMENRLTGEAQAQLVTLKVELEPSDAYLPFLAAAALGKLLNDERLVLNPSTLQLSTPRAA